jgi:hypothetical protein
MQTGKIGWVIQPEASFMAPDKRMQQSFSVERKTTLISVLVPFKLGLGLGQGILR